MCGIAGFVTPGAGISAERLLRMREALAHRGPDDAGVILWDAAGRTAAAECPMSAGLAHRRLSIIDLSKAGNQPMSNEDGSLWIVCNGEIYNYRDFGRELEEAGHAFKSRTDTEIILHLYEQHGIGETLRRINGMFAFGLWDGEKMILARDRVGKKPLFYTMLPDGTLVFASEMKALVAGGFVETDKIDPVALYQVWTVGCTVGERTIYEQVKKLPPAHYAVWRDGSLTLHEYWDCRFGEHVREGVRDEELAEELEALLRDAVRLRLQADVPVGIFLSGGIDSSLVAALAAQLGTSVSSYTVGFAEADFDESAYARQVAQHLGLPNRELVVEERLADYFEAIARQFDEPFGDSSAIPTYFVSKIAREHVTVALTGDGGDELFAGYDSFRQALRIWGAPAQRRQFAAPLTVPERLWEARLRLVGFPRAFMALDGKLGWRNRRRLFSPALRRRVPRRELWCERDKWLARVRGADLLSQIQYATLKTWLPDDFLRKVDTMSMAHALECRCPLLDYRVVEFAARLPYSAKMTAWGRGKKLLRLILAKYLPQRAFERPKQGFAVPFERWCSGSQGARLREQWQRWENPYFRTGAAALLFPENGFGNNFLQWNAFATLCFFASRGSNGVALG